MREFKKNLLTALMGLSISLAFSAHAAPTNIAGVIIDPDHPNDLTIRTDTITQTFDAGPPVALSGWGLITSINTTGSSTFCPGCELTFTYEGYTQSASGAPNLAEFTGGTINIYRDAGQDFVGDGTFAQTSNGVLWLQLTGHDIASSLGGPDQTLFATAIASGAIGTGFLDVAGGIAASFFNTNTVNTGAGFADFDFQNSFTGTSSFTLGSGNVSGDTQVVPEPASIALLGIGLLGITLARRRSKF